ncbi:MAG: carboxypeptidase-like regulatory domain-containing protein, partial [Bacteroidales bacterium]|nr:carboxypeptidase-like regulatory domain-containing protein [Bacteroidales bacterium]
MKRLKVLIIFLSISIAFPALLFAQKSGIVRGKIMDGSNNEPMAFANVYVKGTSLGTVSDVEGMYRLDNVPAGEQTIVVSFIGFADQEIPVNITGEGVQELETITMMPESIMGEEITVTAQMRGQIAAINQQVNSNTIVNVVSKDNIEGIPDMNAAESISRLPGISISRSGGEGS